MNPDPDPGCHLITNPPDPDPQHWLKALIYIAKSIHFPTASGADYDCLRVWSLAFLEYNRSYV